MSYRSSALAALATIVLSPVMVFGAPADQMKLPAPVPTVKVAPATQAPAPVLASDRASGDDFTLIPGDVLQITVWKEEGMDKEVVVLPDGNISFPLIGTIKAQGLTPEDLQKAVKRKLASYIPESSVSVAVKAPLGHTVSVLGQVARPGEIVMSRNIGVMEALSQSGGLTPYAKSSSITIIRTVDGVKKTIEFPYDDISRGRHLEQDVQLKPGDVIVVPTAGLF